MLAGCGSQTAGSATPTPFPTMTRSSYVVQRGDMVLNARLAGNVEPLALQAVFFQMAGHVGHVYVQQNEVVAEGQLLSDLDELVDLKAKYASIRRDVMRAQINLEKAQVTLEQYKSGGHSSFDIRLQELEVQMAQLELEDVLNQYGLVNMDDSMKAIDLELDKARLYAPIAGEVVSVAPVGRAINPTTAAVIIGDPKQLEVVADINPTDNALELKYMFEGMDVTVNLLARPDIKLTGKIRQLPSPYGTGGKDDLRVYITLDQPSSEDTYQSGDKVTVQIELANKPGVLWLPEEAIRKAGGRTFVLVEGETSPQRVEIQVGLTVDGMVEILSGLEEGQKVIGQ
jgi:RND family efflux transporter MFP subunit